MGDRRLRSILACFVLGSFLFALRGWRTGEKHRLWWASTLFLAALLVKETAILLLAYLGGYHVMYLSEIAGSVRARILLSLRAMVPLFAVLPVYSALRLIALSGAQYPTVLTLEGATRLRTAIWVIWFALKQMVWPAHVAYFYDVTYVKGFDRVWFWTPICGLLCATLLLWLYVRRAEPLLKRDTVYLAGFGSLSVLPSANVNIFSFHDFAHDRYSFLAVAAFAGLVVQAVTIMGRMIHPMMLRRALGSAFLFVVLAAYARVITRDVTQWKDERTFFLNGVQTAPHAGELALVNLAVDAEVHGRKDEAVHWFELLAQHLPFSWSTRFDLANAYLQDGQWEKARNAAKQAATLKGVDTGAQRLTEAMAEMQMDDLKAAEATLRQILTEYPNNQQTKALLRECVDREHAPRR